MTSALKSLYKSFNFSIFSELLLPITILSGLKKSSTAVPSLKNSGLKIRESVSKPTLLHIFSISYGGIVYFTVMIKSLLSILFTSLIADSKNFVSTEFVSRLLGV